MAGLGQLFFQRHRERANHLVGHAQCAQAIGAEHADAALTGDIGQLLLQARTFGTGFVTDVEGSGAHARVQVNFDEAGSKWLVLAYANLSPA